MSQVYSAAAPESCRGYELKFSKINNKMNRQDFLRIPDPQHLRHQTVLYRLGKQQLPVYTFALADK